jgi:hypothetical protein
MQIHSKIDGGIDEINNHMCPCLLTSLRKHLHKVLTKAGPYCDEDWAPGQETINTLESSKIL